MSIRARFDSLLSATLLSGGSKAVALHDRTTGGGGASSCAPPGTFQKSAMDEVEIILTEALSAAERVLGLRWRKDHHEAHKHKPYDEREWQIHVLSKYAGVSTSLVAADEDVERYTIENLRRSHGFDAKGNRKKPCRRSNCTVCSAVEAVTV